MADNSDFSQKELEVIKNTWAKPVITGEYPNISFYSYTAMTDKMKAQTLHRNLGAIDNVCDTVFVPTDDDLYSTYRKTYCTLRTIEPLIKRYRYDYIFKTDLCTYVNVPLLDEFVQSYVQENEEVIYTGKIKSAKYAIGPKPFCLFADKSSMLFPVRPYFNVLTEIKYRTDAIRNDKVKCPEFWNTYRMNVDENAMGFIIDNYLMSMNRDHYEYYRDWNMRTFTDLDEDMWHKQIVMNMRQSKCHCGELSDICYVHDVVTDWYLDNKKPDLSYILNYMYSSKCPKIYVVDEDKDSDEYNMISFNDYKQVFSKGTLDISLNISSSNSGNSVSGSNSGICPTYPTDDGSPNQCYHYSYLDYFNIPHHHIDNCLYHYDDAVVTIPTQSSNQNSQNFNSNNVSSQNSSINDDYINPNKGIHVNVGKKPHVCVNTVPDISCDCDRPIIDSVRMCICDNGKHHYVTMYPGGNHHCDENLDNEYIHKHNCHCNCGDSSVVPDSSNEDPSVPEITIPDVSIDLEPSAGCNCDSSSIWCNCVCDEHKWWHNSSTDVSCPCCDTSVPTNVLAYGIPEKTIEEKIQEIKYMLDAAGGNMPFGF